MTSDYDRDDADDFPTPVPGPRRNPTRVILVVLGVLLLLGLIVCAGPFGWVWKRAVGAGANDAAVIQPAGR